MSAINQNGVLLDVSAVECDDGGFATAPSDISDEKK